MLNIYKKITEDALISCIKKNYNQIATLWIEHQMTWINTTYSSFKDHDKYLIIISDERFISDLAVSSFESVLLNARRIIEYESCG